MDRFVSNVTTRLDAKGRISIPAAFRAVLARDGFEGLYVHPSLDWPALDCGGHALMAAMDALLTPLSPYAGEYDTLALALLGESDILKMDSEGRVGLTEAFRHHAGIESEVSLVGAGHKFQIWEPGRFRARLVEARDQARAMRTAWRPGPVGVAASPPPVPGARE